VRVLVACEFSGVVRDAFSARGHDAWSCDLLPSERPGPHYQRDVLEVIGLGWDLMIAHPPCTYLSYAGLRWFKTDPSRMEKAREAFRFFVALRNAPIPKIAIENPKGFLNKWYGKPSQIIQPWQFGEPYTKATCLFLKNLPPLLYTNIYTDRFVNWTEFGHRSAKDRSRTFFGIADAMAQQWQSEA
jgi:site-specific DNA-cytosine methylase